MGTLTDGKTQYKLVSLIQIGVPKQYPVQLLIGTTLHNAIKSDRETYDLRLHEIQPETSSRFLWAQGYAYRL